MSTLESVCAASEAFAEDVLRYLALRQEDPLAAARLRKGLGSKALAVKASAEQARAKRDAALKLWTPGGSIPLPPRPSNDNPSSMDGTLA